MRQTMTMDEENVENVGYRAISFYLPQDMFWPAVMTAVCLGVVLVEGVIAAVLLYTRA